MASSFELPERTVRRLTSTVEDARGKAAIMRKAWASRSEEWQSSGEAFDILAWLDRLDEQLRNVADAVSEIETGPVDFVVD